MSKKQTNKKDYIDEHEEWQRHQFDPGHFTGGRIPIWIKKPGNRKRLGTIFLIFGMFYGGWTIYSTVQLSKIEQATEQVVSAIFLSFAAIVFLWAGIKLIKRSKRSKVAAKQRTTITMRLHFATLVPPIFTGGNPPMAGYYTASEHRICWTLGKKELLT